MPGLATARITPAPTAPTAIAAIPTAPASTWTTSASAAKLATGRTICGRTGLADRNGAAVKGLAIELFDGSLAFFRGAHGNEAESARTLSGAIEDQMRIRHRSDPGEEFFQCAFRGLEGEVADV